MNALLELRMSDITDEKTSVDLPEKAVLLRLTIRAWGISRKLRPEQYEVEADKAMTRASKRLLESPELQAIYRRDQQARGWVASRSLPSSYKAGIYLQPLANLAEVDDYIEAYKAERIVLLEHFIEAYPDRVLQARTNLRDLWSPKNYPRPSDLPGLFSADHDYSEVTSAPGQLSRISGELFRREREKVAEKWERWLIEAQTLLRHEFAALVNHMEDRLQPGEPGPDGRPKPRRFDDTLVTNFRDWLSTWRARNITEDADLDECVRRSESLLAGVTPRNLRSDEGLRDELQRSFAGIAERVTALTHEGPSRVILLSEEED